jgi:hypothetical protein
MTALARQQQQHKSLIMPWRRGHRNCIKIRVQIPPGVDVMITIFCDFCQFSAKNLALFSKTNVMTKILYNLALF